MSGLAIATANGLLLKGGKEAKNSNRYLHRLVQEAIATELSDHKGAVGLVRFIVSNFPYHWNLTSPPCHLQVDSREEVGELLSLDKKINLVIPRGSNELVEGIMEQVEGRIPVLGHAEGICHVYVDQFADIEKAIKIGKSSE